MSKRNETEETFATATGLCESARSVFRNENRAELLPHTSLAFNTAGRARA